MILSNSKSENMIKHFGVLHGLNAFRSRYKRTVIGRIWEASNYLIFVLIMGPLFGTIFKTDYIEFTYYLANGLLVWNVVNKYLNDALGLYVSSSGYILNTTLSYEHYSVSLLVSTLSAFSVYFVACCFVTLFLGKSIESTIYSLLFWIPLFFYLYLLSKIFALLAVLYRDCVPLLNSLLSGLAFFTPIIWHKEYLGDAQWVVNYNPIYPFLDTIRAVSMGGSPEWINIISQFYLIISALILVIISERFKHLVAKYL